MTEKLTPERLREAGDLLESESSIAFYSSRAKETMLLLLEAAQQAEGLRAELAARPTRAEVLREEMANLRRIEREDTPEGALGTRTGLLRAALILDERADAAEQDAGKDTPTGGESTRAADGRCENCGERPEQWCQHCAGCACPTGRAISHAPGGECATAPRGRDAR